MGIWRRWRAKRRRPSSPIVIDRKVIRFRRLVEQHGAILDLFADLEDKQSCEYILDSQYIEARLDRAFEGVRRILYDMHVISETDSTDGYDQLDSLRSASEKILRETRPEPDQETVPRGQDKQDWETLALQALFRDLTRVPTYGPEAASGTEAEPAPPESLTEWAGWGHARAAEWMAEHLPLVSPPPLTNLWTGEAEGVRVQVFLLGSLRETEDSLRQCFSREVSGHSAPSSLLPVRTFLEGLWGQTDGNGERPLCTGERKAQKSGEPFAQIQLYAGDDLLLLRLPPFLPLRLFWCSLSLQASENLIYLYGAPSSLLFGQDAREPFSSEKEPFPSYRCGIAGRWMYWASHFSWAQGEERVRMLGRSLAQGTTVRRSGATRENVIERLQEGIAGFLKQAAMPGREA